MIESRLDGATDGLSNGGENEYTVAEIAEQLRYLATEGHARSVSSVLRIVSEQSRGRDTPVGLLVVFVVGTVLFGCFALYAHAYASPKVTVALTTLIPTDVVLAIYVGWSRPRWRRYSAQLTEIRRLSLETLGVIVGRSSFTPRALTKEQRKVFVSLRRSDDQGWLQVAKALLRSPE